MKTPPLHSAQTIEPCGFPQSRLESNGEADRINISQSTYESIRDHFECEHRGRIPVKNAGEIDMYFVTRPKPAKNRAPPGAASPWVESASNALAGARKGKQCPLQNRRHEGGLTQGEIQTPPSSLGAPVLACVFF